MDIDVMQREITALRKRVERLEAEQRKQVEPEKAASINDKHDEED